MKHRFTSKSEADTRKFAHDIAKELRGGEILALHGDLGAGKTTFVKGLAAVLGSKETITSPTFVLMRVFNIPKKTYNLQPTTYNLKFLVHIDAYRLKDAAELVEIGALDYLGRKDVIAVIEWPERVGELLKRFKNVIEISFEHGKDRLERAIRIHKK